MTVRPDRTLRGKFAVKLLRDHVLQQINNRNEPVKGFNKFDNLPPFEGIPYPDTEDEKSVAAVRGFPGKVCIVGAGAAGIYLAWMLTYLGIEYDLLEASGRIGGRVYTYNGFKNDGEDDSAHNYYDVGAMRIPDIESNRPTLDVAAYLKVPIAPYYLENKTAPYYFGCKDMTFDEIGKKLEPLTDAIQQFITAIDENFDDGFRKLVDGYDQFSTREFLCQHLQNKYPNKDLMEIFKEIQELETFATGTGLFDQALIETVLDFADFPTDAHWYRIEGGTIKLIEAMAAKLATPPTLNKTVRSFKMNGKKVDVSYSDKDGNEHTQTYAAVFNSTTLGALSRIELNGLGSDDQRTAIRSLAYNGATKVAIKSKTAWWHTIGGMVNKDGSVAAGGISGTDLPIRIVAYPAWTKEDQLHKPTILIASYTWHHDAIRMGSLAQNFPTPPTTPAKDSELIHLVLHNLSTIFSTRNNKITYEYLLDQVIDYHSYAWHNDPHSSGAFAVFGPGQFTNLYPSLVSPLAGSDNNIYIIGDVASAHHAWISGALSSAVTALYGYLLGCGKEGLCYAGRLKYSRELDGMPFSGSVDGRKGLDRDQGVPDEMEEEVVYWVAQLGNLNPEDDRFAPRRNARV